MIKLYIYRNDACGLLQNVMEDFDDVVFACGSGGTASGLSIGNYLSGSNLK